ncbi:uncharacterized protein PGTG_07459 [Puccinia graminis f. sp. tritici CRL 75-36-700-3]|uniref:Uncharacterized protein n=2 Tax=Puccinia graminis f. sp. tritici TaxID=56615 RepID=E3KCZ5_PUCGT|nr:uncharacterized protein PGTG_07459 [Puccinia graminis f. sp. tritici CRL 75-36-700-3]EFP82062.1 hypothetical protein PGTG_07459 [Puccinia graminis f. sp. tritici CRL 75-36-700-3]
MFQLLYYIPTLSNLTPTLCNNQPEFSLEIMKRKNSNQKAKTKTEYYFFSNFQPPKMKSGENQQAAFAIIQQAIPEDDLRLAAWQMAKFVKKEYSLTKNKLALLVKEHTYQSNQLRQAVSRLEEIVQSDTHDEFRKKNYLGTEPAHL